jgi:hypothetical protein
MNVVLFSEGNKRTDRYIEAHILKPIGFLNIDKVIYSSPPEVDSDLVEDIDIFRGVVEERLEQLGIPLEHDERGNHHEK